MKERRERREEKKCTALETKRQESLETKVETDTSNRDCQKRTKASHCPSGERTLRHNMSSSKCGKRDSRSLCTENSVTVY